ncbi:MAG: phosphoribosylanthranilate isomerase [Clostridia bacterium]|nr:phosphoribosylanthranilate isomerase [Clostridia bacterium]
MIVQIAGIKNTKEALECVDCGVDAIGLLVGRMHESNDFISEEKAKEIIDNLPAFVFSVMITHLEDGDEIVRIAKYINCNTIQLHSQIKESEVEKIKKQLPYIKLLRLIHISSTGEITTDINSMKYVDAYFLDSFNPVTNQVGGTGLTHNWDIDKKLCSTLNKPVIIAGGLNPDNVAQAIKHSQPFGVDVNSGTKAENGFRDMKKVIEFTKNSKKARW